MQDTILKGTGNSRSIKAPPDLLTRCPTWTDAAREMINGTFFADLNPLNAAGVQTMGTSLNKANLLKDATAALYGLPATAVPDTVFSTIHTMISSVNGTLNQVARIAYGSYAGTGGTGKKTLNCSFQPKCAFISNYFNAGDYEYSTLMIGLRPESYGICQSLAFRKSTGAATMGGVRVGLEWAAKALSVVNGMNEAGRPYYYIILG